MQLTAQESREREAQLIKQINDMKTAFKPLPILLAGASELRSNISKF